MLWSVYINFSINGREGIDLNNNQICSPSYVITLFIFYIQKICVTDKPKIKSIIMGKGINREEWNYLNYWIIKEGKQNSLWIANEVIIFYFNILRAKLSVMSSKFATVWQKQRLATSELPPLVTLAIVWLTCFNQEMRILLLFLYHV